MLPSGMSHEEFDRTAERLVELGWAFRAPDPNGEGTLIAPWMPPEVEERVADELMSVFEHVDQGVWLTQSYLDLAVFDENYVDNAIPSWLAEYFGDGAYILHRWYKQMNIAFVFQPMSYDRKTVCSNPFEADKYWSILRDYIAAGICAQNRVLLIKIQPENLSYEGIVAKISGFLPVKPMKAGGPIEQTMKGLTARYLQSIGRPVSARLLNNNRYG